MVYVTPGHNFEEAVKNAQAVFPKLADVARERIAFSVNVRVGGELRSVRIAPMAWSRVLSSLATYEIIDLSVLPYASSSRAAKSDTEVHTPTSPTRDNGQSLFVQGASSRYGDDAPPMYGFSVTESDDDESSTDLKDSDKSPNFTLLTPVAPSMSRRCASALGWLGKHYSLNITHVLSVRDS